MARNFPASVEDAAYERCQGRCEYCGGKLKKGKYHFDHHIPVAMGGPSTLENCRVLCVADHIRKTMEKDMPEINAADRKGKTMERLQVVPMPTAIQRQYGWKPQ